MIASFPGKNMMRPHAILAVAAAMLAAAPAAAQPAPNLAGLWQNPHRTVVVRTGNCGAERWCGWVAWASAEAEADAKDGGVDRLVGTELLQGYERDGPGSWTGTVFVPDMNRRFSSRIEAVSANELRIRGCVLGGLFCKTQVWTRVEALPR